jgi:sulfonate transport system substrate-binding protein
LGQPYADDRQWIPDQDLSLAKTSDQTATQQLLVRPTANIRTVADLNGKKLGITKIGVMLQILDKMCHLRGCDMSKITLVDMLPQDIALAYEKKDIDAALTWEPYVTYIARNGGHVLGTAVGVAGQYSAVFALQGFIEKNPRTAAAVLRGLSAAAQWMTANRSEASQLISMEMNVPIDIVQKIMGEVKYNVTMPIQWGTEFDGLADYLLNLQQLKRKTTAAEVFDPNPLRSVCSACVSYINK